MSIALFVAIATALVHSPDARAQDLEHWRLVPELKVGDDGGEFTFARAQFLALAPDGRVFVGDAQTLEIFVLDPDGGLERRIAGRGPGPGELSGMHGLGRIGDTIWVVNRSRQELTLFDLNGDLISESSLPWLRRPDAWAPPQLGAILPGGRVAVVHEPPALGPDREPVAVAPLLAYAGDPELQPDTVLRLSMQPTRIVIGASAGEDVILPMGLPRNSDRWAVAPDGQMVVAAGPLAPDGAIHAYRLEAATPDGAPLFRIVTGHQPVPVDQADRDRWVSRFADRLMEVEGGLTRTQAVRRAQEMLPLPSHQSVVGSLFVGSDGRVWVPRADLGGEGEGVFSVHDGTSGEEIARATFDVQGSYPAFAANGRHVWAVEWGELGISALVRYRIEPEPSR